MYKGGALFPAQPDSPGTAFLIPRLSFQSDSPTNVPFNFPLNFQLLVKEWMAGRAI